MRLVQEPGGEQDALGGEEQRVEVQLAVVGEHALHGELGHALDEVEHEEGREEREAVTEQPADLQRAHASRGFGFQKGERNRDQDEGGDGHQARDRARQGDAARDEQQCAEGDDDRDRPECLADAGEVELVRLLQPSFVHIGESVNDLVDIDADGEHEHGGIVSTNGAVQQARSKRQQGGEPALRLI